MKIKSATPLNDGMSKSVAEKYWQDLAGFAAYSFNASHSYEYSLISWITMWLKVYYPAEFYAGALSVVDKEEKQSTLIADAQEQGIKVMPPCIQRSTHRIEIDGEDSLFAPFQAVKGVSEATARAIVELREHAGGQFTWAPEEIIMRRRKQPDGRFAVVPEREPAHVVEFQAANQKLVVGGTKVNAAAQTVLEKVGAYHPLVGGLTPMHPDRLRDRLEYMPGFTVEMVKASRGLTTEHLAKIKITALIEETRACTGCSLQGKPHPVPRLGDKARFMLVFDTPDWKDEREGKMLSGTAGEVVKAGLEEVGLSVKDGYFTALVKSVKPKEQKVLANEQINGCSGYLKQEIDILKPAVIVAMGSNAVRHFAPGIKGSPSDLAGKAIFNAELDATIIFGLNPGMLFHDPSKVTLVQSVFSKLGEVLS